MNEIKCPSCGNLFKADEAGYAKIEKQIRDHAFQEEISIIRERAADEQKSAVEVAVAKTNLRLQEEFSEKEKTMLENISNSDLEIEKLNSKIDNSESIQKIAISRAKDPLDKEIIELKHLLKSKENETQILVDGLEKDHEREVDSLKGTIEFYKDMKQKLSTKMVGETLEEHCESEFNKYRTSAFPNSEFGKDNDSTSGSKGDYIFREYDEDGNEIISIMFDMKDENEETVIKQKNKKHFSKLHKDRKTKNCEYAVLVSLLEKESDFYNQGMVDVSYEYDKMYVVRPQFFITIITLLKNAAMKSMKYKREMEIMKKTNIDITNFNDKIDDFKTGFVRNYRLYEDQSDKAISEIDKAIKSLEKTKEQIQKSKNNIRLANNKLDNLSIKKLTHGNETMTKRFAELNDVVEQ